MTLEYKPKKLFKLNKYLKFAILLLPMVAILWFYGLLNFLQKIPERITNKNPTSDAIVVLTGGSGRLKKGLQLLTRKKAKKLFISGVYRGNDVQRLLQVQKHSPAEVLCCINLGYVATSTAGNAKETADWIKKYGFTSIILVTANYHMPRSLILFRHIMPEIEIVPYPAFPAQFEPAEWWARPRTASLITSEYIKYIIASTVIWFEQQWENTQHWFDTK
jgi:uncharacterized SAM-binding protein YcdF (DUF218 family)